MKYLVLLFYIKIMKKTAFYFSILMAGYFLFDIIKILIVEKNVSNDYTLGYLIGKLILLLLTVIIAYLIRPKKSKK